MREAPLTIGQRLMLRLLKTSMGEGFVPSSYFRRSNMRNPGPMLSRLAARGLAETNGVVMPEGLCYRITGAGLTALETAHD